MSPYHPTLYAGQRAVSFFLPLLQSSDGSILSHRHPGSTIEFPIPPRGHGAVSATNGRFFNSHAVVASRLTKLWLARLIFSCIEAIRLNIGIHQRMA